MKNIATLNLTAIVLALVFINAEVDGAPYQELTPRKGFIPVYIRYGDTPLSEIHPKLAEAFHETALIESADLKKVNDDSTEEAAQQKVEKSDKSKEKEISDIASFDVVNGDDHEGKH